MTLEGANNLTGNLEVDAGTLRFDDTVAPTIAPGVTVNVIGTGTLDLSGFVSAFTGGASGNSITNNSSATSGIVISGTSQVVGNVDGTGTLSVDAGSDLTANHIVENALVIGGTTGNFATVTIDASDASGNSLAAAGGGGSSAATQSLGATQAPAAPRLFATGTLSLLAVPLTDSPSVGTAAALSTVAVSAAASDEAGLQSTASATLTSLDAHPSQPATLPPSPLRSTASASPFSGIGSGEAIVTATDPVSSSWVANGEPTIATGTQAFSTSSSMRSLDGNAVAALFADADVFEWLADSRQSRSSSNEVVDSVTTDALSDDVLSTIGQQWPG